MFAPLRSPAKAYADVGMQTGVTFANSHQLILMLFDGALLAISTASMQMRERHVAEKGEAVSKAINIINDGLKACLDVQAGGELAERLDALYDYMCVRLVHGNLHNSQAALDEVARLLKDLKGAWEEIAGDPAVASRNKATA